MSEKAQSLRERLRRVQAAIKEVEEAGQSVSTDDGISYTRATLTRLYDREKELIRAIGRQNGRNPMFKSIGIGSHYNG
jgi:geranylgeranyl pyrophosphate synthase